MNMEDNYRIEPLRVGVNQAAKIVGISRTRLYAHMKAGQIKFHKDGHRTLFAVADLRAFVERQR